MAENRTWKNKIGCISESFTNGSMRGESKLKLLCYNKEYEKTKDRGMEEMPEMWKA